MKTTNKTKIKKLEGKKFGRWNVIEYIGRNSRSSNIWKCVCDCGTDKTVLEISLIAGTSKSCGCIRKDQLRIEKYRHGEAWKTPEYKIWQAMIQRCCNPTSQNYNRYGFRGITVCNEWRNSYENFLKAMGRRPTPKHTLDREDNNKGYSPENCRWASRKDQSNNTRWNRVLEFGGVSKTVSQWSDHTGIKANTIIYRLRYGWTVENALTKPVQAQRRKEKDSKDGQTKT